MLVKLHERQAWERQNKCKEKGPNVANTAYKQFGMRWETIAKEDFKAILHTILHA